MIPLHIMLDVIRNIKALREKVTAIFTIIKKDWKYSILIGLQLDLFAILSILVMLYGC